MSKLLYMLEDHFDALAEQQRGLCGWLSRGLRSFCAYAGDIMRAPSVRSHHLQ